MTTRYDSAIPRRDAPELCFASLDYALVFPANAGTPGVSAIALIAALRLLYLALGPDGFLTTDIGGYGSRRSPGRRGGAHSRDPLAQPILRDFRK